VTPARVRTWACGLIAAAAFALPLCAGGTFDAARAAAGGQDQPGRLIRLPDGRHLNFRCSGHGSPTVLLEIGFSGTSLGWSKVQRLVEQATSVCAYDRAGAGFSDPGPPPRDAQAVARDLNDALRAGRIAGPYVIVGHSSGGLYARVFAARRHADIAGMVLVDPTVEYQDKRFAAVFGPGAGSLASIRERVASCLKAAEEKASAATGAPSRCVTPGQEALALRPSMWLAQLSELDTLMAESSEEVSRARLVSISAPVIVLTADHSMGDPQADALWSAFHREVARNYENATVRDIASSHMMITERPDVVAGAIVEVVAKSRRAAPPGSGRR
jgi:pimeloyl-ACP methyl ester carboxylesterase